MPAKSADFVITDRYRALFSQIDYIFMYETIMVPVEVFDDPSVAVIAHDVCYVK